MWGIKMVGFESFDSDEDFRPEVLVVFTGKYHEA